MTPPASLTSTVTPDNATPLLSFTEPRIVPFILGGTDTGQEAPSFEFVEELFTKYDAVGAAVV